MNLELQGALIGIIGVLVGALLAHRLTIGRDRDTRRRDFNSFLSRWRSEIDARWSNGAFEVDDGGVKAFEVGLHQFFAEAKRVQGDFSSRNDFDGLVVKLGSLKVGQLQGQKKAREIIFEALDALIRFTETETGP